MCRLLWSSGFVCNNVFVHDERPHFALDELICVKNRRRVPKQYQSWVKRAEGAAGVTALHIFISVKNDYCNMC